VRILKHGAEELEEGRREERPKGKNKNEESEEFRWHRRKQIVFQAIKQGITNNAMASQDAAVQYQLALDASMWGLGGVSIQVVGIPAETEVIRNSVSSAVEWIIRFLSLQLSDGETQ